MEKKMGYIEWTWVSVYVFSKKKKIFNDIRWISFLSYMTEKWVVACVKDIRLTYDFLTCTLKLYFAVLQMKMHLKLI